MVKKKKKEDKSAKNLPIAPIGRIINKKQHDWQGKVSIVSDSKKHVHEDSYLKGNQSIHKKCKISDDSYYSIKEEESSKKRKKESIYYKKPHKTFKIRKRNIERQYKKSYGRVDSYEEGKKGPDPRKCRK